MAARIRALRPVRSGDDATGDLFRDVATGQDQSNKAMVHDVVSKVDSDGGVKRARPVDDESQLLDVDQLYPASHELNTRLSAALGLLLQGVLRLERGLDAIRAKDSLGADDQVSHLLLVLQEMFCYRDLGEGFGNVISACIASIQNTAGHPLTEKQLIALNSALHTLRKKPFLTFESSLEVIERLESAGFIVEVQGLDAVQDWLVGSGVR